MKVLFFALIIYLAPVYVFAQVPVPQRSPSRVDARQRREEEMERQRLERERLEDLKKVTNTKLSPQVVQLSQAVRLRRSAEQAQRLAPNPQDLEKYAEFLKSGNTGIFKLFSDLDCDSKYVVKSTMECESTIPFTWSYSFLKKDYGDRDFFDLRFKNERLVLDSFLSQNIVVPLGDIPLENISLSTGGMKFLVDFKPETREGKIREQFWQIANKISVDGFNYAKVAIPRENVTYAMRVIAYRISSGITLDGAGETVPSQPSSRLQFASDDRTRRDKVIAFRILRKDVDGSYTIIWKELADKKSPKLEFDEIEKLTSAKLN